MSGGGGGGGHTLIVMVGEYYGGTEKRGLKTHLSLSLPSSAWSNAQLAPHTAAVVSDANTLRLWLYYVVNSALPLASSKYYYSHQRSGDVSRGEDLARRQTYVLALKGVEEVSTQLPVIPWGPRRIANAT